MSMSDRVIGTQRDRSPSPWTLRGLDGLNFVLADVQAGVGPFVAIFLAGHGWNEERVGIALTVAGVAGILTQTPAGALVDARREKRALVALAALALSIGALMIALFPTLGSVLAAQALIGGTSSVFIPAICAISLGIVGRRAFDARQGRNQAFNAAGNVSAAIAIGLLGYWVSNRSVFFFVIALALPTCLSLLLIRPSDIDHDLARGASDERNSQAPERLRWLWRDRPLAIFLGCSLLFHFANAAMLPLLGERLAKGQTRGAMPFMSACVLTTQLVISLISNATGHKAQTWGRKPLLLIGFGVLPIRAVLYTLTDDAPLLIAIQVLDGIGAGIFNVVSVLVIADLTRGSGRFNVTLGAIATAVGIGASLSQFIAGSLVRHFGTTAGFLFLAAVASAAFALLALALPETLRERAELYGHAASVDRS